MDKKLSFLYLGNLSEKKNLTGILLCVCKIEKQKNQ